MPAEAKTEGFLIEFSTTHLSSENPAAYFDAVSQVLAAFESLDANLLSFILPESRTRLSIEKFEVGSFKLWLAAQLEDIPEQDLRGLDYWRIAGHFLVKGRDAIVRSLRKTPKIVDEQQVEELGQELDALARESFPSDKRFSRRLLISILVRVIRATQAVPSGETVKVTSQGRSTILPRDAELETKVAISIAEKEIEPFEQEMRLLVKKPDMLGRSQWDFLDRGHVIRAKMGDARWVDRYQHHAVTLKPGDAVDARVRVTPRVNSSDSEFAYEVLDIRRVIPSSIVQQPLLFASQESDLG